MMSRSMKNEREQMLFDISTVSFLVLDMALYLDTHPYDRDALEYFNHYSHVRSSMLKEFANKYYPLTLDSAEDCKEWKWALASAPWEGVC